MGLLETGSETYFAFFKISIVASIFIFLFSRIFDLSSLGFPEIKWDIADINSSISALRNAKGFEIAVALPRLIVSVFALLIEAFINSIIFINFIINRFLQLFLFILPLSQAEINTLAAILSWIIMMPAIIGITVDIGRIIFYILFGMKR